MANFLYFCNAANDGGAWPVENLGGIDTAAGKLHFYFTPHRITDVVTGDTVDKIDINVPGGDEKAALQKVVEAMNTAHGNPFLVIADDENSIYVTDLIDGVDLITYAA